MAVATPSKPDAPASRDLLPEEPPDEHFWQKYSPHYELPIGTFASGAIHLALVGIAILLFSRLMKTEEKPRVPVRGMIVQNDTRGGIMGDAGSGSLAQNEAVEQESSQNQQRQIPDAELKKELVSASNWIPELKDDALEKIVQTPNYDKIKDLNDDLKKRLKEGLAGKKAGGTDKGSGPMPEQGAGPGGSGGAGDATSSGRRSLRWVITFNTRSGEDYLTQLSAFKAKLVFPEPPNWKTNRLFEVITSPNPGKSLKDQELPGMEFTDSDKTSASKAARALGLDFDPPYFTAFFPKDVEDDMAEKEKRYRNRKEDEIYSTTFRVIERDGRYLITVTDQIPAKRK